MDAARRALDRSRPGDLVVLCVDYATEVYKEIEQRRGRRVARRCCARPRAISPTRSAATPTSCAGLSVGPAMDTAAIRAVARSSRDDLRAELADDHDRAA